MPAHAHPRELAHEVLDLSMVWARRPKVELLRLQTGGPSVILYLCCSLHMHLSPEPHLGIRRWGAHLA